MSIAAHVRNYKQNFAAHEENELAYFRGLKSIEDVIRQATLGVGPNGKMNSHQWRLGYKFLGEQAKFFAQHKRAIRNCKTFGEIMETLEQHSLKGFGELALYDTALRIGAWLGILPDDVYLHRGTLVGFRRLGLKATGGIAELGLFPKAIQALPPHHVENFLCIFKDELGSSGGSAPSGCGKLKRRRPGIC